MPIPNVPGTPGFFAHGSPGGTPYTVLSSDWANAVQMELCNVITTAGLTLSKTDQTQLLQAMQKLCRIKLSTTLDLYVAVTGNDSNNGTSPSTPLRTLQQAVYHIYTYYELAGNTVVVHVGNGTYTGGASHWRGINGTIKFVGNEATPSLCKIQLAVGGNCFAASNGAVLWVSGFALEATHGSNTIPLWSAADVGLWSGIGSQLIFEKMAFGPMTYAHIWAGTGAWVGPPGEFTTYTIYGGANHHIAVSNGAVVSLASIRATVTGNPAFVSYFAYADASGFIWAPYAVFTGAATGTRYGAHNGSLITTLGGGPNFFPGSIAGISTTGYYQ